MVDTVTVQANAKIKCLVCPTYFQPKRSTAKYCSDACRQTAKRDRDILWQRVIDIERMIFEIVRTDSKNKLAALQRINRKIKYEVMQATEPGPELIKSIKEYMKA